MADQVTISPDGKRYLLRREEGYCPVFADFCRSLQGSRWNGKLGVWSAARSLPNALDLKESGRFEDAETLALMNGGPASMEPAEPMRKGAWTISCTPFQHQEHWRHQAERLPRGMLVAEMGLGKTLMAMLWWSHNEVAAEGLLIVCPNSLTAFWATEIEKFTGVKAVVVAGPKAKKEKLCATPGLHIMSYDSFVSLYPKLPPKNAIVFDESHKIKNPQAARSKAAAVLAQKVPFVLCLTGTPISQGPHDYYGQFKVVHPRLLGPSFTAFKHRYCVMEQVRGAPFGVQRVTGYKNLEELNQILAPYIETYYKKDCLDLPPKVYKTIAVELSAEQRKLYDALKHEFAAYLEGLDEPITAQNFFVRLTRLTQITQGFVPDAANNIVRIAGENPKLEALKEVLEEIPNEPVVIICRFLEDIKLLQEALPEACVIQGDVSVEGRTQAVKDFQEGKFQYLIGQIATTGLGFTLTRASTVVFFSNSYSLIDRKQAEDRIHRIGSAGDQCLYVDIVARDTVDESIAAALRTKQAVSDLMNRLQAEIKGE